MNSLSDQQLLRDYTERRSEAAFTELVRRHVDLVYSAALRMVRDTHLAEDVTQSAFVALAQSAGQLSDRPVLSGWLHRTAQNLASKSIRSDVRRRAREQEAAAMNELLSTEPDTALGTHRPASRRRAGRVERARPRRAVAALLRAQVRARDGANPRHDRRRRAKTRQPRRRTPARSSSPNAVSPSARAAWSSPSPPTPSRPRPPDWPSPFPPLPPSPEPASPPP